LSTRIEPRSDFVRLLANSPPVLDGYVAWTRALAQGSLRGRVREQIALFSAARHGCEYCTAAHMRIAPRMGIDQATTVASMEGRSADPKVDAMLQFVAALIEHRGNVSDRDLARLLAAGWTEADTIEIVANVALNVFRNYLALVARLGEHEPPS
jgi:AhpD family alkylhydroperoxidase